jgi:hypothetical protein
VPSAGAAAAPAATAPHRGGVADKLEEKRRKQFLLRVKVVLLHHSRLAGDGHMVMVMGRCCSAAATVSPAGVLAPLGCVGAAGPPCRDLCVCCQMCSPTDFVLHHPPSLPL